MLKYAEEIRQAGVPGRYEGLTAFEAWLCDSALGDSSWWDESTGSSDFGAWSCRIGKRCISVDAQGFHYVRRYPTEAEAVAMFADEADSFEDWEDKQERF